MFTNALRVKSVCLSLLIAVVLEPSVAAGQRSRPNVIVVMTDDQGYGEFSCNGNPIASTPHIDRLARGGIRLTDFHVSPMCTPTRGQLLTGLDAFRNGAINVSSGRTLLRPNLKTIADLFRMAGYVTGMFGKWHLGDNYPFRPSDRGFDKALWFPSSHINSVPDFWDNDYFNDTYLHDGKRQKFKGYCTDVFFNEAMRWMKQSRPGDRPFFTYIALNAAHWPWFVPEKYRGPVREAMNKNSKVVAHLSRSKREDLVSFLAMGANIDDNMGKLERFLVDAGLRDNTIVVFLTDNGSTMGPDYFNAGMRGRKTTLWEGGHRVPCFIRWPGGGLGEPRDIGELCHVQDLLPTLADLAGVNGVPKQLDGVSLAPLFRGQPKRQRTQLQKQLQDRMLVINYSRMPQFKVTYTRGNPAIPQRDGAAVLWKQWRFLENRWLYDVRMDPHQDNDVAGQHPEVVARMRDHLNAWWASVKDRVLEPQRVMIGSDAENPIMLTACEWLDVFVDQQRQIRNGPRSNGVWHLVADRAGVYEVELRRWPRESGLKLNEATGNTRVTDGVYIAGQKLPIASARLRLGKKELAAQPEANCQSVRFEVRLEAGPIELQTWFLDAEGTPICGAYYAYLRRLESADK